MKRYEKAKKRGEMKEATVKKLIKVMRYSNSSNKHFLPHLPRLACGPKRKEAGQVKPKPPICQ